MEQNFTPLPYKRTSNISKIGFLLSGLLLILIGLGTWYLFTQSNALNVQRDQMHAEVDSKIAKVANDLKNEQQSTLNSKFEDMLEVITTLSQQKEDEYAEPFNDTLIENLTLLSITPENLIRNSSFESGENKQPRHWNYILDSTVSNTKQNQESVRSGIFGLKFEGNISAGEGLNLGISQPVTKTVPNRTYTMSLYVKSVDIAEGTTLRFGFWDEYSNRYAVMEEIDLYTTADWARIYTTQTTSGLMTDWANWYPIIEVRNHKKGAVYIDDVLLSEGDVMRDYSSMVAGNQNSNVSTILGDGSMLVTSTGTMYPAEDGVGSLGTTSQSWRDLYLTNATISEQGDMDLSGDLSIGDNLIVNGSSTFVNNVDFQGSTTFSDSTNFTQGISVGENNEFTVNGNGNITSIYGVSYSFPNSQGGANEILVNDGNGNLSWGTFGSASVTADSLDFAQFADDMILDAELSVNMYDGSTSRNITFYNANTGRQLLILNGSNGTVGIGTTDTNALLTVGSSNPFTVDASGVVSLGNIVGVTNPGSVLVADSNGAIRSLSNANWDTDATDDLTNSTTFLGDISGPYNNLQINPGTVGDIELSSTSVTAGSYGSTGGTAAYIPQLTINEDGRITSASTSVFNLPPAENPLTFSNGLSRTGNTIKLGGVLTEDTRIYDGSYEYIYFDTSNGNIGIGTTDPTAKFHVVDGNNNIFRAFTDYSGQFTQINGITSTSPVVQIDAGNSSSAVGIAFRRSTQDWWLGQEGNGNFSIADDGTAQYLTIESGTGFIGLGTTNPATKLDVLGDIRSSGQLISTASTGTSPLSISSTTLVSNLNADMVDGASVDTAYNSFGNGTIPKRHPSGYLFTNYLNTTANVTTTNASHFAIQTGSDNYIRWQTPTEARASLGLVAGGGGDIWVEKAGDTMTGNLNLPTIYASNWFRAQGATGLYFETYGTGIRSPLDEGGTYGSVSTYGGENGWEGYSIDGKFVFMSDLTNVGIYNDINNRWIMRHDTGISTDFYEPDSGTVAMSVYASGNVGIGAGAPISKLSVGGNGISGAGVYGNGTYGVYGNGTINGGAGVYGNGGTYGVYGNSNNVAVYANGGSYGVLSENSTIGVHSSAGNIGVRSSGTNYDFYANGPGTDYGTGSSIRWKRDLQPIDNALDKVLAMRGLYYTWDEEHGGQRDMGMIAEEVGQYVPEIVGWDPDAPGFATGMDYGHLTPVLVEAIKEQQGVFNDRYNQLTLVDASLTSKVDVLTTNLNQMNGNDTDILGIKDEVISLDEEILNQGQQIASLQTQMNEIFDIVNKEEVASEEANIASLTERVSFLEQLLGAETASASTTEEEGEAKVSTDVLENLTVTGKTNLFDLGVVGDINAGQLVIHGNEGQINSLGLPLEIQSESTNPVKIMGGKVTIETNGDITVKESITAKKYNVDTSEEESASIGEGTIKKGEKEIVIETTSVTESSKIFLTPTKETEVQLAVVEKERGKSFKVRIVIEAEKDISFNWWIVN